MSCVALVFDLHCCVMLFKGTLCSVVQVEITEYPTEPLHMYRCLLTQDLEPWKLTLNCALGFAAFY